MCIWRRKLNRRSPGLQYTTAAQASTTKTVGGLPPAIPDEAESIRRLHDRIDVLHDTINDHASRLFATLERKATADIYKDRMIDKLHAELSAYKDDIYASILKPVLMDLIIHNEGIAEMLRGLRAADKGPSGQWLIDTLENLSLGIVGILERYGVEVYQCEGDSFNASRQRATCVVKTADIALNGTIESRTARGYGFNGRVLIPEQVIVYKYDGQ